MSTSVFFKPIAELPSRLKTLDKKFYNKDLSPKVRRALFGASVDHAEARHFLDEELAKQAVGKSRKWDFDFINEMPINQNDGRFVWSIVTTTTNYHPSHPVKQRRDSINDDEGATIDLYCESVMDDVLRPRALKPEGVTPPEAPLSSSDRFKTQRLITDFMPSKKRSLSSASAFVKRLDKSPAARPSKLQRTHKNIAS